MAIFKASAIFKAIIKHKLIHNFLLKFQLFMRVYFINTLASLLNIQNGDTNHHYFSLFHTSISLFKKLYASFNKTSIKIHGL